MAQKQPNYFEQPIPLHHYPSYQSQDYPPYEPPHNQGPSYNHGQPQEQQNYSLYPPYRPEHATQQSYVSEYSNPPPISITKKQWRPFFCWIISLAQICVLIAELGINWKATGTPIEIKPSFNPLIGPSPYTYIHMGARYDPCMKYITNITGVVTAWPCLNDTSDPSLDQCTLREFCGFGMTVAQQSNPDQWWRFIVPIFLHGGIVHIAFNLLVQLRIGAQVESTIGIVRFALIYFASGIFGFLLGGNFAPDGLASTGCSGSLFGIIACVLLDLLYNWNKTESPVKSLIAILIEIIVSFVLGLLPGVDNFSHIGGFLMGLFLGVALLESPDSLYVKGPAYTKLDPPLLAAQPVQQQTNFKARLQSNFRQRRAAWWFFSLLRMVLLALAVLFIVLLTKNFYSGKVTCSWCKYLSCLPVSNWCETGVLTTNSTST